MTNKEAVENNNVVIFEADDVNDPTWDVIISVLRENIPGFHVGYGDGNYMAFAIPKEFQREEDKIKSLENKIGTWLDAHSCEDDEYYEGEE